MKLDLANRLPKELLRIIKIIGRAADEENFSAYIVGGPVRDILLNLWYGISKPKFQPLKIAESHRRRRFCLPNCDLDFVVEGDGIVFSQMLNKVLRGDLKIHRAFRTATIVYKGLRIDVVTARKESYERCGSYPDVTPGRIKDDLYRRDFTINAMAVSINNKNFGDIVDFYNGLKDLKEGLIRVMHDKSFIDDPTRIFRAVRFSVRFDFTIEPHTMALVREAASGGFLGEVNRGRIRKEIELFLKEKDPLKCLRMFAGLV